MSVCKFCLQNKKLIRKSHILPSFMYDTIRQSDGEMLYVELDSVGKEKKSRGVCESDFLCQECDGITIQKWEKYFQTLFYPKPGGDRVFLEAGIKKYRKPDGLTYWQIDTVDYDALKRFFLSVLWRSGASTSPFFKEVRLGSKEAEVHSLLTSKDLIDPMWFPCLMTMSTGKLSRQVVSPPIKFRDERGAICYLFQIGPISLMYFVSKHSLPDWVSECIVRPPGTMVVPLMPKSVERDLLAKTFRLSPQDLDYMETRIS